MRTHIGRKYVFVCIGPIEDEMKLMLRVHAHHARKDFMGKPTNTVQLASQQQSRIDHNLHVPKVHLNQEIKEKAANRQPFICFYRNYYRRTVPL